MEQEGANKKQKMDEESTAVDRRKEFGNLICEFESQRDKINKDIKVLESKRDHLWLERHTAMENQGPIYRLDYTINGSRSRSQQLVGFFMSEKEANEVITAVKAIKMKKKIVLEVQERKHIAFTNGFDDFCSNFEEYKQKNDQSHNRFRIIINKKKSFLTFKYVCFRGFAFLDREKRLVGQRRAN